MRLRGTKPARLLGLAAVATVSIVTAVTSSSTPTVAASDAPVSVHELRADGTEVEVFSAAASAGGRRAAATATPRSLPNKTRYYVESHLPSKTVWPYKRATRNVNKLTRSSMKYGRCPQISAASRYGCIKIYEKRLAANVIGVATWWGDGRVRIDLNPAFRKHSWSLRYSALVHELGHGFGLNHNPSCKSVMYWSSACMVGKTFTTTERRHLRTQ
jgi:hypothetical protein